MKKQVKASPPIPISRREEEGGSLRSGRRVSYGFHLVKGKRKHPMEDYVVAEFRRVRGAKLGLFAIFDGHSGREVPNYLKENLFDNILKEPNFWERTEEAIKQAYVITDEEILDNTDELGRGGSTAVTAILINDEKLVVANVGDSRAVICSDGVAKQLSVDHDPDKEQRTIEEKGGFVTHIPGDVPRVDGQLAMARSFGDRRIKAHLSSKPHVTVEMIDSDTEFIILASDGLWMVMTSEEAVDAIKDVEDAQEAAEQLVEEALSRNSTDDISTVVIRFH
ncbi:unnamed protein product [Victoria cruziana]